MDQLPNDFLSSEGELEITQETSDYLIETTKWAKFIAVTFYILTILGILYVLIFGSYAFRAFGSYRRRALEDYITMAIIVIVICVVVVGVTYYFLLSFANKMRVGLETENIEQVNGGLGALKTHMIIIGILLMLGLLNTLYELSKYF